MDWQTTEKIENEFYKLNPLMEKLKDIRFYLSKKNTDKEKLLKEFEHTVHQLEDQQGIIFNMIDEQRNK